MIDRYPEWLREFQVKIEDEFETMLLLPEETNPSNLRFENDLGIIEGSVVLIKGDRYRVKAFQLYSNLNNTNPYKHKKKGFYFDLHIIVSKV